MADDPKPAPPPPVVVEQIPSIPGSLSALASAHAPFIYFDSCPNYGFNAGVANLSLEAIRFTASPNGQGVLADRVTVAHLRMSLDAVRALKAAIEGIELLAAPAAGGQRN
jgi:hypothetical protein